MGADNFFRAHLSCQDTPVASRLLSACIAAIDSQRQISIPEPPRAASGQQPAPLV
jgi:hypothetical protein